MTTRGTQPTPSTVTLADVARHVGVSARTVSRVVNDEGGCTEATRQRILSAIEELGYRPNLLARGLIRRRSDTIGLVAAEMSDPFFPEFADGVERAANDIGRTMFLASCGSDPTKQHRALTSLVGHGVDGAIVFPAANGEESLIRFARDGLPIVVVNYELSIPGIGMVTAEIEQGAAAAVAHLLEGGRRRVAFLMAVGANRPGRPSRREAGYRSAHERAGRPVDDALIIEVANSIEGGRRGVDRVMSSTPAPDAIFAYNDVIAIGALQQSLALGRRVPDDLAIVGFDDITMCDAMSPSLSSVRIDRDQLGRAAVETLRELAETGATPPRRLPVQLVARASSG